MHLFGIDWVGVNADNGRKLLLSLVFVAATLGTGALLRATLGRLIGSTTTTNIQTKFWARQGVSLLTAIVLILGLMSIWFSDPARLATAFGLMSAGLAFALQQVITSVAGYFVILRGANFTVGDRISMGGVRGDVLALGFIQTTIMEMGEPEGSASEPGMWVKSRQFTGRIVTVSNSKIFSDPVYNYTRDFPFIWEEMMLPITYEGDAERAEAILLEAARLYSVDASTMAQEAKDELQQRFGVQPIDLQPGVFWRLTSNWLELTVRFLVHTHEIRRLKDRMSRHIYKELKIAGVSVASSTYDIVGLPPLRVQMKDGQMTGGIQRGDGGKVLDVDGRGASSNSA